MAKDEKAPEGEEAEEQKEGGGLVKTIILGVGFLVLMTISNVATLFVARPHFEKMLMDATQAEATEATEGAVAPPSDPPIYHPLLPPMVVNFSDGSSGFLQVSLEVMARNQEIIDAVKDHDPAIRNSLLMLFAAQEFEAISSREGKEMLRSEVLNEIQQVLEPYTGSPNVEDVYFTAFVAQ